MNQNSFFSMTSPLNLKWLPALLSLIAGSVDVISFLGLNGLFTSHITGNLVILAVRIVDQGQAPIALILSVPMFIISLCITRVLVFFLETSGYSSLLPLLCLQSLLLFGFLLLSVHASMPINPNTFLAVTAGMLGVSAMAVQNALVALSLKDSPATAVMTSNITRLVTDLGELVFNRDSDDIIKARRRVQYTWPTIIGFSLGCCLGAICEHLFNMWALIIPFLFSLIALF